MHIVNKVMLYEVNSVGVTSDAVDCNSCSRITFYAANVDGNGSGSILVESSPLLGADDWLLLGVLSINGGTGALTFYQIEGPFKYVRLRTSDIFLSGKVTVWLIGV